MNPNWSTVSASVRGSSHEKTGAPCQDESAVKISADGKWVALVVSDGAGTAARADEGSKHVVKHFSEELLKLVKALETQAPGNWVNDFVIEKVLETRKSLRSLAQTDNIRDFNCTLVACLQGPSGGFAIHIGDGTVLGGYSVESNGDCAGRLFVSKPENGEYANETFFITEKDWIRHLRIMPMPKVDWVLCCTDGGGALALLNDDAPKIGFLEPVMERVFSFNDEKIKQKALADYLSDVQSNKVTGDDKTLAIAIRPGHVRNLEWYKSTVASGDSNILNSINHIKSAPIKPFPNNAFSPENTTAKQANNSANKFAKLSRTGPGIKLYIACGIIFLIVIFFSITFFILSHDIKHDAMQKVPPKVKVSGPDLNASIPNDVASKTVEPTVSTSAPDLASNPPLPRDLLSINPRDRN